MDELHVPYVSRSLAEDIELEQAEHDGQFFRLVLPRSAPPARFEASPPVCVIIGDGSSDVYPRSATPDPLSMISRTDT
jgi:hypothetical protein